MTQHATVRRILIAYKTGLLGRGLQSLLEQADAFDVVAVSGSDGDLAAVIRNHTPHVIIVEHGALSPQNAHAVLTSTLEHPETSMLGVGLEADPPTLWRALGLEPEGSETFVEALRRHLAGSPLAP